MTPSPRDARLRTSGDGSHVRGQAQAQVTASMVRKYAKATRAEMGAILDRLVEVTGWHRDHARKARDVAALLAGEPPPARARREPVCTYGPEVIEALQKLWAVLDGPTMNGSRRS